MSNSRPEDRPAARGSAPLVWASDLPDIRNRLIANLTLPASQNLVRHILAMHAASGLQRPADPRVRDPYRQADLLLANEVARLRNSTLFWMSPDVTALCLAAAKSMPAALPGRDDLPSPCGMMYFAVPFGAYEPLPRLYIRDKEATSAVLQSRRVPVFAVSWGPWTEQGRWPGGGTWFTFYSRTATEVGEIAARHGLRPEQVARMRLPPLMIDNELACPASDAVPLPRPLRDAVSDPESLFSWMHLVLCASRIMAARRTASVTTQVAPRPARRRSRTAGVTSPEAPVHLVDLRPGSPRPQAGGDGARRGSPQVRFTVRGHWRNQYYAREDAHRLVWIEDFLKGPEDAPYRAPRTVYVLREPGEPARRPRRPEAGPELEL